MLRTPVLGVTMGLSEVERETIRNQLRAEGASYVALFGSYARDEETPASDVDVLVRFSGRKTLLDLARIEHELSDALGKPVELVTEPSLHPLVASRVEDEKDVLLA